MKRKRAEESLRRMMNLYQYKPQKGRDRGYFRCPNCNEPFKKCPYCDATEAQMLLPKAKGRLDFIVMVEWAEVECKQGTETWSLTDFTKPQENLIAQADFGDRGMRWIFLEIGTGKAPSGKEAYLIPAVTFRDMREKRIAEGYKTVRFRKTKRSKAPEAREVFGHFALEWVTGGGWAIPEKHEWWGYHVYPIPSMTVRELVDSSTEEDNEQQPESTPTPARLDLLG